MTTTNPNDPAGAPGPKGTGVLRRDSVRVVAQPAMVDCASGTPGASLTVVPLMDGDRVAGLEVRCSCGANTLIECIYPEKDAS